MTEVAVVGMKRACAYILLVLTLALCGCGSTQSGVQGGSPDNGGSPASTAARHEIAHRYATASEARDLMLSRDGYYAGFSQNDLDFRMQRTGASMEEYKSFAAEQTRDFTNEERDLLDRYLASMADALAERGYTLPPLDEVTFVKTTMKEECGAGGCTSGSTIYLSEGLLEGTVLIGGSYDDKDTLAFTLWHELFHCLTRRNPEFRADMYELIHFSVHDADYALPPSVTEYHISNPDVEHHDSSAVFRIDGRDVECFTDWVTTRHFQQEGDTFFNNATTALVPVDGSDVFYTPEQAANYDEVFGRNTEYVTDPEECMADNFALAMTFGTDGQDGTGYPSPDIIEGIIAILSR